MRTHINKFKYTYLLIFTIIVIQNLLSEEGSSYQTLLTNTETLDWKEAKQVIASPKVGSRYYRETIKYVYAVPSKWIPLGVKYIPTDIPDSVKYYQH